MRSVAAAAALASLALAAALPAQAATWTVDRAASALAVVGKASVGGMGLTVELGFSDYSIDISFDRQNPTAGSITATVRTPSATADVPSSREDEFYSTIRSADWLATENHPVARFTSTTIKARGENRFAAVGKLTIAGTTRQVTLPFTLKNGDGAAVVAQGQTPIDRKAFGIGGGTWDNNVAQQPTLHYRIVAQPDHG